MNSSENQTTTEPGNQMLAAFPTPADLFTENGSYKNCVGEVGVFVYGFFLVNYKVFVGV
jgi:hypothetical protein